jgi:hypothetical protein
MVKAKLSGEKGNLSVGQGLRSAVADIPHYGMAQVSKLQSDLMPASGFQVNLHQTL